MFPSCILAITSRLTTLLGLNFTPQQIPAEQKSFIVINLPDTPGQTDIMAPYKVAVLDDYQNVSEPVFAALDRSQFEVTTFRDTLRPYDHPDTTDAEREALTKRLEPFDIICASPPYHIRWNDTAKSTNH